MGAATDMFIHSSTQGWLEASIEIVRNLAPDILALHSQLHVLGLSGLLLTGRFLQYTLNFSRGIVERSASAVDHDDVRYVTAVVAPDKLPLFYGLRNVHVDDDEVHR